MWIRLLGPVELRGPDGAPATVGGPRRRAALALLALECGRVVPVERLIELLWGEQPPPQARAAVQAHVAALRKALAAFPMALTTRPAGYLLSAEPEPSDAGRFRALTLDAERCPDDAQAAGLLRDALGLWRGAALADLTGTRLHHTLAAGLEDSRVEAVESWAQRALRGGDVAEVLPVLTQVVQASRVRERATSLLMRCLDRAGRRVEALDVYERARQQLAEELGIDPGPQLREAFDQVSRSATARSAAATTATPEAVAPETTAPEATAPEAAAPSRRTLLPALRGFVGRRVEHLELSRVCLEDPDGGIAVVVGPAGVGKTSTVLSWAHECAQEFPDGQFFADLGGFGADGPADPAAILYRFLCLLGVPKQAIPDEADERAALFRSTTAGRRLLIVLDNAASPQQVRALLPGGPPAVAVVTSRNTLEELMVGEGAALLPLGVLPLADAHRLLADMIGTDRAARQDRQIAELVELCDSLPLALRIAGARLATRPTWAVADLVEELRQERTRLAVLETGTALGIAPSLELTRRRLPDEGVRLLALLALHPGGDVDVFASAALLGADHAATRRALGSLAAYHVLVETTPGRYERHDLVRLYGAGLLEQSWDERHRDTAFERLLDYYLAATLRACAFATVHSARAYGPLNHHPAELPPMPDGTGAMKWFRAEESGIRALIGRAEERGEHDRVWRLADNCHSLAYAASSPDDWISCLRIGLRAARRSGDAVARVRIEGDIAMLLRESGRSAEALEHLEHALALATRIGDDFELQRCRMRTAIVHVELENLDEGLRHFQDALESSRATGDRRAEAQILNNLSHLLRLKDRAEEALQYAREAGELLAGERTSNTYLMTVFNEAEALESLGRDELAEREYRRAARLSRVAGNERVLGEIEGRLGGLLERMGRFDEAREHLRAAVEVFTRVGHERYTREYRARLERLATGADA
jgi:DNA-binding SARP family transcriptional activator/Tfp pilus assembly protein PilF